MASVPVFCRDFGAGRKKAPEGGCSPGKKGLMILYLFNIVGVRNLERDRNKTLLIIGLDYDTNLSPVAALIDVCFDAGRNISD